MLRRNLFLIVLFVPVLSGPCLWAQNSSQELVLWNKMGNDTRMTNSEFGVAGSISGPQQYAPVQHKYGHALASKSGDTWARFYEPFDTFFPDEGCI